MSKEDTLMRFSERMKELCDDAKWPEHGRQTLLAKVVDLTPNAARKWLHGLGMPEMVVAVKIADWAKVSVLWLLQGLGPKYVQQPVGAVILGEALHDLGPEEARAIIDNVRYRVDRAFGGSPAKLTRYRKALDSLDAQFRRPSISSGPFEKQSATAA